MKIMRTFVVLAAAACGGCEGPHRSSTHHYVQHLVRFKMTLEAYSNEGNAIFGPTLRDAAEAVRSSDLSLAQQIDWDLFLTNTDPWGKPWIFERTNDDKDAVIKSFGPNGVAMHSSSDSAVSAFKRMRDNRFMR